MNTFFLLLLHIALNPILGGFFAVIEAPQVESFADSSEIPSLEIQDIQNEKELPPTILIKKPTKFEDLSSDILWNLASMSPDSIPLLLKAAPHLKAELTANGLYNFALSGSYQLPELRKFPYHDDMLVLGVDAFPFTERGRRNAFKHFITVTMQQMEQSPVQERYLEFLLKQMQEQDPLFRRQIFQALTIMFGGKHDFIDSAFVSFLKARRFDRIIYYRDVFYSHGSLDFAIKTLSLQEISNIVNDCFTQSVDSFDSIFNAKNGLKAFFPRTRFVAGTLLMDQWYEILSHFFRHRKESDFNWYLSSGIEYVLDNADYELYEEESFAIHERMLAVIEDCERYFNGSSGFYDHLRQRITFKLMIKQIYEGGTLEFTK